MTATITLTTARIECNDCHDDCPTSEARWSEERQAWECLDCKADNDSAADHAQSVRDAYEL